jgi:hypothetical protein
MVHVSNVASAQSRESSNLKESLFEECVLKPGESVAHAEYDIRGDSGSANREP